MTVYVVNDRVWTTPEAAAKHILDHSAGDEPVTVFIAHTDGWGTRSLSPAEFHRLRRAIADERQLREAAIHRRAGRRAR
jgi:hypothetical protein